MEPQLDACGTAVQLRERRTKGNVYHESNRVSQFQFQEGDKKGSFPSEDAVLKAIYLRITELYKKWNGRPVSNWALVRNQPSMDDKIQKRILKYEDF